VLAFFWPLITPSQQAREYFVPGDFWLQVLPFHTFAARQLAAGKLALWDPYMFSGHPFQADIQTAVTYPIAAANEWLGGRGFGYLALEWEALVHFGLAATFTFLLVELLTGSLAAGLLGGVVFGFGGFLTSYPSQQLPVLESTVWLPLELYCLERAGRTKGWLASSRWIAAAGACVGLAVIAGHPQTVLYLAYIGAAYFLFRLPWRAWWQAVWAVLPAVGLAAVQLLPSLQLFQLNRRGKLDFSFAAGGLQPGDLGALLLDQPNGGRILYVGLAPLALMLAAIVLVRNRQVVFWASVAVVGLLLSLGTYGPLFRLFFDYLPGWNLFRDQTGNALSCGSRWPRRSCPGMAGKPWLGASLLAGASDWRPSSSLSAMATCTGQTAATISRLRHHGWMPSTRCSNQCWRTKTSFGCASARTASAITPATWKASSS